MTVYEEMYLRDLANDVLTRVRNPKLGRNWDCPKQYRAGDKGEKNGRPYTIKCFTVDRHRSPGALTYAKVRFRGEKRYTYLWIGEEPNFQERFVEVLRLPRRGK